MECPAVRDLPILPVNETLQQLGQTLLPTQAVRELLLRCIDEDGGRDGDVTSQSIIQPKASGRFAVHVRGEGVIAGVEPLSRGIDVFGDLSMTICCQEGEEVQDATIAHLEGNIQSMLLAERTILNVLGHACGIATVTKQYVKAIADSECIVCDTRKTTPGLRMFDKYAVACGGGTPHRVGLHDAALFKDNHLAGLATPSLTLAEAIKVARQDQALKFVEVEVDSLQQLEEVLLLDVDIVLLDNFSFEQLPQAVEMRNNAAKQPLLEASGGITLETVRVVAQTGVDRVAVGALTHQAPWVDIGLDAIDE
jgi:nicotinate-nucleotide pyrophosphorylase (carboxylating)